MTESLKSQLDWQSASNVSEKLGRTWARIALVSNTTGMKWCDGDNAEYLAILRVSATDAAAPATREVWTR